MSSNSESVANFCAVTGAPEDRAKFFLDAANGDLSLAIDSFFDNDGSGAIDGDSNDVLELPAETSNRNVYAADSDEDDDDYNPAADRASQRKETRDTPKREAAKKATKRTTGIFTMNQMINDNEEDDDESDDGDEKRQSFYAGGSSTSGQQILGPRNPDKKKNPEGIIKDLFAKAKEHGAEEVEDNGSDSNPRGSGTGYRLGTGAEPQEVLKGPTRPAAPKKCVLKLWKNGFNVDDGQLRSYSDPANKEFLSDIQKGVPPRELIRQAQGGEVHLDMQDHRDEDFEPPKRTGPVLYNDGYKLGDGSTSASAVTAAANSVTPTDKAKSEEAAKQQLRCDATKPTTQIQIRLADGSRLIVKLNHTHAVRDIRKYIVTSRPEYAQHNYSLLTSFPNKELTDDNETVQQGSLLNAVIIQKLK